MPFKIRSSIKSMSEEEDHYLLRTCTGGGREKFHLCSFLRSIFEQKKKIAKLNNLVSRQKSLLTLAMTIVKL